MVPGRALHRLAKVLLPSRVCDQIIDAQLADFQHEWVAAAGGRKRALVLARGYAAFVVLFASCALGARALGVDERRDVRRVWVVTLAVALAAMIWWVLPLARDLVGWRILNTDAAHLEVYRVLMVADFAARITPLVGALALVCGITIGLGRHATPASRRVVIAIGLASFLGIFVLTNWALPLAIREYTYAKTGDSRFALQDSTLGELSRYVARVEQTPTNGPGTIRSAQVLYHLRWSWPFATFALTLFAVSLSDRGWIIRLGLGISIWRAYYLYLMGNIRSGGGMITDLVWTSHLAPIVIVWLPNLIVVALSVVIMSVHHRGFREGTGEAVS